MMKKKRHSYEWIDDWRYEARVSQQSLAKALCISESAASRKLHGLRAFTLEEVQVVLKCLNQAFVARGREKISLDELLLGTKA